MKKIAVQRAELDCLEQSAITNMLKEDQEYRHFAAASLNQAVDSPDTALQSAATTERDAASDVDIAGFQSHDLDETCCKDDWNE